MRIAFALAPIVLLAACGGEAPEPSPSPTPTTVAAGPRTLLATGFQEIELGPKIVGPQGPEVSSELSFEGQPVASMTSYVACPAPAEGTEPADECDPSVQEDGAIYTYVMRITSTGTDTEAQPYALRTARRASGFANNLGFDRQQAEAALGEGYRIVVQEENGFLTWRIEAGNGWGEGEEITFFWQSELPPEGPAEVYEIESNTGTALLTGPFPPNESADPAETASGS